MVKTLLTDFICKITLMNNEGISHITIALKFHLMSIHVIAQGIVSIRSFSFRKEAEIKNSFYKIQCGCYMLLYSNLSDKMWHILMSKDDFHYRQSHTESES